MNIPQNGPGRNNGASDLSTPAIQFCGVPPRARCDDRLAGSHHRALQAIAYHDRSFSTRSNNRWCYAKQTTLARETKMSRQTFNEAARDLEKWKYVECQPNPTDKRERLYRVVYDEEFCRLQATQSGAICRQEPKKSVGLTAADIQQDQSDSAYIRDVVKLEEISLETQRDTVKQPRSTSVEQDASDAFDEFWQAKVSGTNKVARQDERPQVANQSTPYNPAFDDWTEEDEKSMRRHDYWTNRYKDNGGYTG